MKILAVIPARGGSRGIRHKNIRLMAGKPLIHYAITNALSVPAIDDLVFTSDDEEILNLVRTYEGVFIRKRPSILAGDDITLDPVIHDACLYMEEQRGFKYDMVITLQPTSPTLQTQTLKKAINYFIEEGMDSLLSVTDTTHLEWIQTETGMVPAYKERLNRQWLPKKYRETGAFFITKREFVTEKSRMGNKIGVFPLEETEAIDIDSPNDWLHAEALLQRKSILFVVSGNQLIGMGHIYRTLTLADSFLGNKIQFLLINSDQKAQNLVEEQGWQVMTSTLKEAVDIIKETDAHIIINDILDTEKEYIENLINLNRFVINFEDLGEGAKSAHLVINALYEHSSPPANHRFGSKYVCLHRRFLLVPPPPFKEKAETLMVTFGGVDINNLSLRTLRGVLELVEQNLLKKVIIVLGAGYGYTKPFFRFFNSLSEEIKNRIEVIQDIKNMANIMKSADLAITSNGRTVYELASLGIPTISIAQNDRETLHLFARYSPGVKYMGIACNVKEKEIRRGIIEILSDNNLRENMRNKLLEEDIRGGLERVKNEIQDSYRRWNHDGNKDRQ